MNQSKAIQWVELNKKFFPKEKLNTLKQKMLAADDAKYDLLFTIGLNNPSVVTVASVFLGGFGVDRFMIGDTGMGILKLLTGGCCGVLCIVDWFTIGQKTREVNYTKVLQLLLS